MVFDVPGPTYRLGAWVADQSCRSRGILFGDRGIFVAADLFARANGFPDMPFMEDLEFSLILRRAGVHPRLLRGPVLTSARRFAESGIVRGGWWAWLLCRDYPRGEPLDAAARRFYERMGRERHE